MTTNQRLRLGFTLIGLGVLTQLITPVLAQDQSSQGWIFDFEDNLSSTWQPPRGLNSSGTEASISQESVHSGRNATKIAYSFSEKGFIDLNLITPVPAPEANQDKLYFSAWVYGNAQNDVTGAAVRLLDAKGEVFQYRLPPAAASAFGSPQWQQIKSSIDLSVVGEHWGVNSDGKFDKPLKFLGFGLTHSTPTLSQGVLYIDDVSLSSQAEGVLLTQAPIRLDLPVKKPEGKTATVTLSFAQSDLRLGYIAGVGKPVSIKATADATSGQRLAWSARDFNGRVVAEGIEPIRGTTQVAPTVTEWSFIPSDTGIYYIQASLRSSDDQAISSTESRLAVLPPPNKPLTKSPFLFAIQTHLERLSDEEMVREVELMRAIGFPATRTGATWSRVQPTEGTFQWQKSDRIFETLAANDVLPLAQVGFATKWASTGPTDTKDWNDWGKAPPRVEPFLEYTREMVKRYKKYTHYWEVWNEPDIGFWRGTAEQYAELFNATSKTIREIDPTAQVMNGGFSETYRKPEFIPTLFGLLKPQPDIYAYHSHGNLGNLIRATTQIRRIQSEAGSPAIPLWLNEAGFSNWGNSTERDQAETLAKKMAYAATQEDIKVYVWYDLRNDGTDTNENEHNFGLVRRDFSPKASMVAAHTTMHALAGKKFVKRLELGPQLYALLFADARETLLVLWGEVPATNTLPQLLKSNATSAESLSLMGVRTPLTLRDGWLNANARREPQFVVMRDKNGRGGVEVQAVGSLLSTPSTLQAPPSSLVPFNFEVSNPFNQPLQGRVSLTAPANWKVSPLQIEVNVTAGGKQNFRVEVLAPSQSSAVANLRLQLQTPSIPQPVNAEVPLTLSLVAPELTQGQSFDNEAPPIVALQGKPYLISFFEATPMTELHFHGAQDLSAQVYLASSSEGIRLRVRVQDDVHWQKETPQQLWKSDSVQFALATPLGQHYEWTAALTAESSQCVPSVVPQGVTGAEKASAHIERKQSETLYEILIPATLPGLKEAMAQGCKFNVLVNDDDGQGRKGWLEWAPGIGRTKDPSQFQAVVFRSR